MTLLTDEDNLLIPFVKYQCSIKDLTFAIIIPQKIKLDSLKYGTYCSCK